MTNSLPPSVELAVGQGKVDKGKSTDGLAKNDNTHSNGSVTDGASGT